MEGPRKVESINSGQKEKLEVWQKKREEIDKIADAAGHGIDEGIKEAVVAANLTGLTTEQSCEGHVDRGGPYPFLEIAAPNQPKWSFIGEKENFEQVARESNVSEEYLNREWSTWEAGKINEVLTEAGRRLREKMRKGPLPLTKEAEVWRKKNTEFLKKKYFSE